MNKTYYLLDTSRTPILKDLVYGYTTVMGPAMVKLSNEGLEKLGSTLKWVTEEELPPSSNKESE